MVINPLFRQSNLDICYQALGATDSFIAFLESNEVNNFDITASVYNFDALSIINKNYTGYKYATSPTNNTTLIDYVTQEGDYYITQSGENYIIQP